MDIFDELCDELFRGNDIEKVKALPVKYGADIHKMGGSGETPYERAKKFNLPCVPLLDAIDKSSS